MSMGGLRENSILQGNMGLGDDLGKFRQVGFEPLPEFLRRAGDRLVAGDAQALSTSGADSATLAPCWMALTMWRGVLAGTNQPCQLDDSKPASPLSATVGTSGSAAERFAPATASARKVPAVTCGSVVAIGATATWISPVMRAGKMPASPLYGTGWMSIPAAVLNISMVRCSGLPAPVMP